MCVLYVRLLLFVNRLQTRTDTPSYAWQTRYHLIWVNFCSFFFFFGGNLFAKSLWGVSKSPILLVCSSRRLLPQIVDPGSRRLPYVKRTEMFVGKVTELNLQLRDHATWVCLRGFRGKIRLSQSRSLGFLVWCSALRAHSRATGSKARLVSKSKVKLIDFRSQLLRLCTTFYNLFPSASSSLARGTTFDLSYIASRTVRMPHWQNLRESGSSWFIAPWQRINKSNIARIYKLTFGAKVDRA